MLHFCRIIAAIESSIFLIHVHFASTQHRCVKCCRPGEHRCRQG